MADINASRFRAIVEDQTDLICRFTPDGILTFVNEAYCRFQGKSRQELLGTSFLQNLPETDAGVALSYFSELPAEQPTLATSHLPPVFRGAQKTGSWRLRRFP